MMRWRPELTGADSQLRRIREILHCGIMSSGQSSFWPEGVDLSPILGGPESEHVQPYFTRSYRYR